MQDSDKGGTGDMNIHKPVAVKFPEHVYSFDTGLLGTVSYAREEKFRRSPHASGFQVTWSDGTQTIEWREDVRVGWAAVLSRETAEKCLKIVKDYVDRRYGEGWEPKLYEPGHEGAFWNISLEGAEDWAYRIGAYDETEFPGVFTEPVYSWCLALYPES